MNSISEIANLDRFFNLTLDMLCVAGVDGYFKRINPAFEKVLGYTTEEMLTRPFVDFVHPDDLERTLEETRKLGQGIDTLYFENRYRCKNGEYRWLAWKTPGKRGNSDLIYAVARDITDQKKQEADLKLHAQKLEELAKALHSSEERWQLASQANNDGVWDWDLRTNLVYFSPRWKSMLGYEENEVTHNFHGFESVCHPEDLKECWDMVNKYLANELPAYQLELRLRHKDGRYRWIFSRGVAVRDEEGKPYRMVGSHTDITEKKERELQLKQTMDQFEAASRAKSEFLSRMSHELRTPLHAVLGFGQLLEMGSLTPDQGQCVEHILKAGRHLLELINEILDISRIEEGRLTLSMNPVDPREIVEELTRFLEPLAREKNVRIGLAGLPQTDLWIRADRHRLQQVLLNLGGNAIKYNRPGGSVAIAVNPGSTGFLQISFSDTGIGLTPDKIERLFVPFERLGAEQTGIEGTGLGLALAKRLVEAMGGRLLVSSIPAKGSTFTVEMPVASDLPFTASITPETARTPSLPADRTLLYIEDNLANRDLIQHLVQFRPGLRLLCATTGRQGLEFTRQHRPHLILLDLHLPDISGEEVLGELKSDFSTKGIPVAMLSADATPNTMNRLLDRGAAQYLTKPLNMKMFLEVLDRLMSPAVFQSRRD